MTFNQPKDNCYVIIALLILISQIVTGFLKNKNRFCYPLVEYPFKRNINFTDYDNPDGYIFLKESSIPLHYRMWLRSKYIKFKYNILNIINSPFSIITYPSIFGFNHSFARGTYQIFSEKDERSYETIKVFDENGFVPEGGDRSGFLKPLNLHVVYGQLGIIYHKIIKYKQLSSLNESDLLLLKQLFSFSNHRYVKKFRNKPNKSTLFLNLIRVPDFYTGYFNGVNKKNCIILTHDHITDKTTIKYLPDLNISYNNILYPLFQNKDIIFDYSL